MLKNEEKIAKEKFWSSTQINEFLFNFVEDYETVKNELKDASDVSQGSREISENPELVFKLTLLLRKEIDNYFKE